MRSRVRRLVVVVAVVAVVAGAAAVVLTTKPDIDDARDRVDARWTPLRAPLQARYQLLAGVDQAMTAAGAGDRAVIKELRVAFDRWAKLAGQPDAKADAAAEAETANTLEALARRAQANYALSDRLNKIPEIKQAIDAYRAAVVPDVDLRAYNRAVRRYQEARSGFLESAVAAAFGLGARPILIVGG
jgi:hypothetical protein